MKNYLKTLGLCLCLGLASQAHALNKNDLISNGGAAMISQNEKQHILMGSGGNHVLKWKDFNLTRDEEAQFISGNFLNIVKGANKSVIDGTISGINSRVYLVNPNGITIGRNAQINTERFGLSTAKLTDKMVEDFKAAGHLKTSDNYYGESRGIGKVKIFGKVKTSNLTVDASQIIIRDFADLTDPDGVRLLSNRNSQGEPYVVLKTSTKRIDVGGSTEQAADAGFDPAIDYSLSDDDGLVSQIGKTAIGTADELQALKDGSGEYWLYDDVSASLNDESLGTFTGNLDGAFNSLSYKGQGALFDRVENAEIKNLKIKDAQITIEGAEAKDAGALAGTLKNSKLENVEVKGLTVETAEGEVTVGALAGRAEGRNELHNVTASGLKVTSKAQSVRGSLIGKAEEGSEIVSSGITYGYADDLTAVGEGNADLASSLSEAIIRAQEKGESFAEIIIRDKDNSDSSHSGFMLPYFVEDFEDEYDGTSHSYQDRVDNEYFASHNHIAYDNDANGPLINAGEYHFELTSEDGERYFVKNGEKSAVGDGIYTITQKHLGTIEVDVTVKEDGSVEYEITNPNDLEFAGGDGLDDLDPSFELSGDPQNDPTLKGESDNPNYTFDTELGEITIEEKEEDEFTPPIDPGDGDDKPILPTDPDDGDDNPNQPTDPDEGGDRPALPSDPDNGADGNDDNGNSGGDLSRPEPPLNPGLGDGMAENLSRLNAGMIDELAPCDFCKGPDKLLQGNDGASFSSNKKEFLSARPDPAARQSESIPPLAENTDNEEDDSGKAQELLSSREAQKNGSGA